MSRRALAPSLALALALSLSLVGGTVHGHDYWLESEGDGYLLYRGHRHSQHAGDALVPYEPGIITSALCASARGEIRRVAPGPTYPVRIQGPCAAVMVDADSGEWTQTLTGTRNLPRDQTVGALRSWRAMEGVKRLERWSPSFAQPLSQGLELVPTEDPFALRPGDKLRLLVTWQGRPREGVTVAYDGEPRGVSGPDGRINLRVRHSGTQAITASFEESGPEAGPRVVRTTALLFDLP